MPHVLRRQGILAGTGLAVFLALVHTVNDAITAILGALLPTLQERFQAGPTAAGRRGPIVSLTAPWASASSAPAA
jgi:hypothetical protein